MSLFLENQKFPFIMQKILKKYNIDALIELNIVESGLFFVIVLIRIVELKYIIPFLLLEDTDMI